LRIRGYSIRDLDTERHRANEGRETNKREREREREMPAAEACVPRGGGKGKGLVELFARNCGSRARACCFASPSFRKHRRCRISAALLPVRCAFSFWMERNHETERDREREREEH